MAETMRKASEVAAALGVSNMRLRLAGREGKFRYEKRGKDAWAGLQSAKSYFDKQPKEAKKNNHGLSLKTVKLIVALHQYWLDSTYEVSSGRRNISARVFISHELEKAHRLIVDADTVRRVLDSEGVMR
jgi:hypothetical protein